MVRPATSQIRASSTVRPRASRESPFLPPKTSREKAKPPTILQAELPWTPLWHWRPFPIKPRPNWLFCTRGLRKITQKLWISMRKIERTRKILLWNRVFWWNMEKNIHKSEFFNKSTLFFVQSYLHARFGFFCDCTGKRKTNRTTFRVKRMIMVQRTKFTLLHSWENEFLVAFMKFTKYLTNWARAEFHNRPTKGRFLHIYFDIHGLLLKFFCWIMPLRLLLAFWVFLDVNYRICLKMFELYNKAEYETGEGGRRFCHPWKKAATSCFPILARSFPPVGDLFRERFKC